MRRLIVLAACAFFAPFATADIITLFDGKMFEGQIIDETDACVRLKMRVGIVTLSRNDIASLEKKQLPEDFFASQVNPVRDKVAEPAKPTTQESNSAITEQKPLSKGPPYEIRIGTTTYERSENRLYVHVDAATNLPNGALIYGSFKRLDNFIISAQALVQGGAFSMTLGPVDKKLPPANYTIEMVFIPEKQRSDVVKGVNRKDLTFISDSRILSIGKSNEISAQDQAARNDLSLLISTLEILDAKLNDLYSAGEDRINIEARRKQFNEARAELTDLKKRLQQNASQSASVLFPQAQRDIGAAAECLSVNYLLVYNKSKNFERLKDLLNDAAAIAALQNAESEFIKLLNGAKEEIESSK